MRTCQTGNSSKSRIISFVLCVVIVLGMIPAFDVTAIAIGDITKVFWIYEQTDKNDIKITDFANYSTYEDMEWFITVPNGIAGHWGKTWIQSLLNDGTLRGLKLGDNYIMPVDNKIFGKDALGLLLFHSFGSKKNGTRTYNGMIRDDVYTQSTALFSSETGADYGTVRSIVDGELYFHREQAFWLIAKSIEAQDGSGNKSLENYSGETIGLTKQGKYIQNFYEVSLGAGNIGYLPRYD